MSTSEFAIKAAQNASMWPVCRTQRLQGVGVALLLNPGIPRSDSFAMHAAAICSSVNLDFFTPSFVHLTDGEDPSQLYFYMVLTNRCKWHLHESFEALYNLSRCYSALE
jgi:hypothetical protein